MLGALPLRKWSITLAAFSGLCAGQMAWTQVPEKPDTAEKKSPTDAELAESLVQNMGSREKIRAFFSAFQTLTAKMDSAKKEEVESAAQALLAKANQLCADETSLQAINTALKEHGKTVAAGRLLQLVLATSTVKQMGKGQVAIGQLKVGDGKLAPDMVVAQMVIQPDGWFATEIGTIAKPLGFRAAGYLPLDVKLPEAKGVLNLGTVEIKPLGPTDGGLVRGKVAYEGPDGAADLKATLNFSVPPVNSLSGGYRPRKKWPQPEAVTVAKDGTFEIKGVTPGEHVISLQTGKHEDLYREVSLKAGETNDLGTLTLRSTDLGFHLKKDAPKAGKIAWEKDVETARKRALAENRPMMIMMTATWCGPCKMLEGKTLSDPWVQQFLKGFVLVKAYEDKAVEKEYGLNGYPTLVFTDHTGKEKSRTVGYQTPPAFSGQILWACQELDAPVDPDLKTLSDKQVVRVPPKPKKPAKVN